MDYIVQVCSNDPILKVLTHTHVAPNSEIDPIIMKMNRIEYEKANVRIFIVDKKTTAQYTVWPYIQ